MTDVRSVEGPASAGASIGVAQPGVDSCDSVMMWRRAVLVIDVKTRRLSMQWCQQLQVASWVEVIELFRTWADGHTINSVVCMTGCPGLMYIPHGGDATAATPTMNSDAEPAAVARAQIDKNDNAAVGRLHPRHGGELGASEQCVRRAERYSGRLRPTLGVWGRPLPTQQLLYACTCEYHACSSTPRLTLLCSVPLCIRIQLDVVSSKERRRNYYHYYARPYAAEFPSATEPSMWTFYPETLSRANPLLYSSIPRHSFNGLFPSHRRLASSLHLISQTSPTPTPLYSPHNALWITPRFCVRRTPLCRCRQGE